MSTNIIAILLGILIIIVFFAYRARWKKKQEAFREELIEGFGQDADGLEGEETDGPEAERPESNEPGEEAQR